MVFNGAVFVSLSDSLMVAGNLGFTSVAALVRLRTNYVNNNQNKTDRDHVNGCD